MRSHPDIYPLRSTHIPHLFHRHMKFNFLPSRFLFLLHEVFLLFKCEWI
jgi:hypothetical protein